jgi:hypothetical protein
MADCPSIIREIALRYPGTTEQTVCSRTGFKIAGKAFVYLGVAERTFDIMVKLASSLPEARRMAAKADSRIKVGSNGWVTAAFPLDDSPPKKLFDRWIDESHALLIGKEPKAAKKAKGGG